jgi:hypothetical protein
MYSTEVNVTTLLVCIELWQSFFYISLTLFYIYCCECVHSAGVYIMVVRVFILPNPEVYCN